MIALNPSTHQAACDEFESFLPGLTERLRRRFRHKAAEARSEAVAEGVALAWLMFLSARQRGKAVGPGTLAYFAGKSVEAGRKVAGNSNLDAMADTALSKQRIGHHVSLEAPGMSHASFYRTFGDKRWRWPVVDYVAPQMDLEAFEADCSPRDRRIIEMKLAGHAQTEIAAELGITPAAISQRIDGLRRRWNDMSAA